MEENAVGRVLLLENNPLFRVAVFSILKRIYSEQQIALLDGISTVVGIEHPEDVELVVVGEDFLGKNIQIKLPFIREIFSRAPLILVAETGSPGLNFPELFASLSGLLSVKTDEETFLECIRAVKKGAYYFHGVNPSAGFPSRKEEPLRLSPRQQEVLGDISQGLSNREIARKYDITESTVKMHVQRIRVLTGIKSRVLLAEFARKNSIV